MELTALGVRFLLSPAAMSAVIAMLALPPLCEGAKISEAEKTAGIAWLAENGYLVCEPGEKPILSKELAFMVAGVCLEKNALIWQVRDQTAMIACCFRGVYLLCWRMRVGKWAITPYADEAAFQQELDEQQRMIKNAKIVHRAQMMLIPASMTGMECIKLLHQKKEA